MTRHEKHSYLQSKTWEQKRLGRMRHDGWRCTSCHTRKNLTVHHLKPENYGHEQLADIITLCRACHNAVHNTQRGNNNVKAH